jgi:hypothetical protein
MAPHLDIFGWSILACVIAPGAWIAPAQQPRQQIKPANLGAWSRPKNSKFQSCIEMDEVKCDRCGGSLVFSIQLPLHDSSGDYLITSWAA